MAKKNASQAAAATSAVKPTAAGGLEATQDMLTTPSTEPVTTQSVPVVADQGDTQESPAPVQVADPIPNAERPTAAAVFVAVGNLYNLAGQVSSDLSVLLGQFAAEPELHACMSRIQVGLGDLRHMVDQVEASMSEGLRDAIAEAIEAIQQ